MDRMEGAEPASFAWVWAYLGVLGVLQVPQVICVVGQVVGESMRGCHPLAKGGDAPAAASPVRARIDPGMLQGPGETPEEGQPGAEGMAGVEHASFPSQRIGLI